VSGYDLVYRDSTRRRDPALSRSVSVRVLRAALPFLKVPKRKVPEVSVNVVGSRRMRTLNRTWRGVDKPTDVLAFPLSQPEVTGYTHITLGDVFVCPSVVRVKAKRMGNVYRRQMQWTLAHGFLHLAGYDHERSARAAREMAAAEADILEDLD
jgi:rRNA maturation RNase YbeY